MKKHIFWGAVLLPLFAASCSNDDIMVNGNEPVAGQTISLQANITDGSGTRMAYVDDVTNKVLKFNWSDKESFQLYKGTGSTATTFSKTANGNIFTGTIPGGGTDTYYAVYGNNIKNTNGVLYVNIANQTGVASAENGITTFMLAEAKYLTQAGGMTPTLSFDHKLTVLKMTLTLPDDVEGTVSMVTVSGLHNKASYSLSDGTYSYADEYYCAITATNGGEGFTIGSDHTITAYVAVFPEYMAANQVKLIANVGFNDYAYTITNARTLTTGKVVPVSASLALVEKNFKPAYIKDDYKIWSEDNCKSAPTADEMKMYLGAGVYWDAGTDNTDGNQQTYTVGGSEHHAGLWMMKKEYISGFSEGKAKKSLQVYPKSGRPMDINKYFFLPAAGYYYSGKFYLAGSLGFYWSSLSHDNDFAYRLCFASNSSALMSNGYRFYGYLLW